MRIIYLLLLSMLSFGLLAQEDDRVTEDVIAYDQVVTDTITQRSFFDRWTFRANEGDVVLIRMSAADGLAPLIGITGAGGDLIARSDATPEGEQLPDAEPNTVTELEFTAPESREYVIVATRVGLEEGTTTGSYTLALINMTEQARDRLPVTFRCGEEIATTALSLRFFAASQGERFRISVYGLDDLQPVIQVTAGQNAALTDCNGDAQLMGGDTVTWPQDEPTFTGETLTLPDDSETHPNAAQFALSGGELLDNVTVTIGSIDGASGRYLLVLEGFSLAEAEEQDFINVQLGPRAAETDLLAYMVQAEDSRIDPLLALLAEQEEDDIICDDAGRRDCDEVPTLSGAGVVFNTGTEIIGDRFSAGLRLNPGSTDLMTLGFSSRASSAQGDYALLLIGQLPE